MKSHLQQRQTKLDDVGETTPDQQAALAEQLDGLAEMPTSTLRQQLYKTQPPKRMSRDLLLLAVSWKVQARSRGGLSAVEKRKLIDLSVKSNQNTASSAIRLKPGTRLVREWHGDIHEVLVLDRI